MSGVKGKSGRKRKRETQYDDWVTANPGKVVELLEKLYEAGANGDREAAIYVIDRILGKPRQSQDVKLQGGMAILTPQFIEEARTRLLEAKAATEALIEGKDAIQEQGTRQTMAQDEDEEKACHFEAK